MSWSRAHRRYQLVYAVLTDIAGSGRPVVPARWQAEVEAEFGDCGEFLRDVQIRWDRAFDARLDALLEVWPPDMHVALVELWLDLAKDMPTVRFLLDAHIDHEALADLHSRHRRELQAATGVYLDEALIAQPAVAKPTRKRRSFQLCHWMSVPRTSAT